MQNKYGWFKTIDLVNMDQAGVSIMLQSNQFGWSFGTGSIEGLRSVLVNTRGEEGTELELRLDFEKPEQAKAFVENVRNCK